MQLVKANRDALLKPLQVVSGIVERRQTLPILANILVRKEGGRVSFTATDLKFRPAPISAPATMRPRRRSLHVSWSIFCVRCPTPTCSYRSRIKNGSRERQEPL